MVKELGAFFEQFTGEYLRIVEGCEIVEVNHKFQITREDYKAIEGEERQARPSDIDVLGTKGDDVHVISCKELIDTQKVVDRIERNLVYVERAIRREFPNKKIVKRVACISKQKRYKISDAEILFFKDMVDFLLRNKRGRASQSPQSIGSVQYFSEWLIRALDFVEKFLGKEEARKIYGFPPSTHVTSASEFAIKPVS